MKKLLSLLFLSIFLFSCNDPAEPVVEDDPENFELIDNSNLNSGFVFGMEIIDDQLFFLHESNPGYINKDGEITFSCCATGGQSRRFRPSFTRNYTLHPIQNLIGFNVFSSDFGELRGLILDDYLGGNGGDFRLVSDTQKELIHPERTFDLNGNHLILNLIKDGFHEILILEIDFGNGFGSLEVNKAAAITASDLGMAADANAQGLIIQSVKKLEDQWIAHIRKAGEDPESGDSFLISKDGSSQLLIGPSTGSPNFRFYDYAQVSPLEYLISESPVGRISLTNSPLSESKEYITELNGPLMVRSDGDKGLIFMPGTEVLSSLENFRENAVSNHQLTELDRTGLNGAQIYDVQFFGGKVYVATRSGLYVKSQENFWEEVRLP
ncbi:hypothetical protein [Arthrospiribacter ruber]|uniref:Lipoprotein n=1 Tax=Arthrospiribacter ruber TaxID=2487934 RepID=A0A951IUT4_9BACT|nr:hypothetical protein [Arthrospiribacter ruber]MBW3466472.1 hypothetical protein [Arthrospiribacter ruber]